MTAVPPIHVINLDRSPERLRRFLDLSAHLGDVNRFQAVDGAGLDREALIASGRVGEDLAYGPGRLACALSHIGLWEMAAAEDRCITIMEDDAVTSRQFHACAEAVLEDLEDWDFVYWGCNLNPAFAWVELGVSKVRLEGYGPARYDSHEALAGFQAGADRPSAVRMLHAFGLHGYSISPRGARTALEHCLPLRRRLISFPDAGVSAWNTNLDVELCGLFPAVKAFLCVPPLVIRGAVGSDRDSTGGQAASGDSLREGARGHRTRETQGARVNAEAQSPRIVASMTTIPSRIEHIRPAIESALNQTAPVAHLELNLPRYCARTHQEYPVPRWLGEIDRLFIFRTEDYGPITKIAPTLLRYENDNETYLWSIDDDCAYPRDQLELLCRGHDPDKQRILTRHGGTLNDDGTVNFLYGEADVSMFEAFGGVLYPPRCIGDDFLEYLRITSSNEYCRMNDDMVLSLYFNSRGVPIHLYNKPSEESPYMNSGWLNLEDALSVSGHEENYRRIFAFIKSLGRWLPIR